ncbi:MAG: DUF1194 domain-containing protein [Rhizobiaceae bacterium]|nr:DUF1194 domain-containing protein [Rhizobiaceae bacterium]
MHVRFRIFVILFIGLAVNALHVNHDHVNAQPQYCDLALVLAMDASSSVDDREYALQMKGMASALLDQEVQEAIESIGGLYLSAFEWNGQLKQKIIFDWIYVRSRAEALTLAAILARHERNATNFPTALGAALGFAHRMFPRLPQPCARMVIDVAGDGHSNDGIQPSEIYNLYDFSGIQVNGLVIKDHFTSPETFYRDPEKYYRENVIRGTGAFLELAHTFDDFESAMKKKLLKEIVPGPIGMLE